MKARYKTFSEFMKDIKIAHEPPDVLIVCRNHILYRGAKPWNSQRTRKTFLARIYIKEVLQKKDVSKLIKRIEGYELLGKRCLHNDFLAIICGTQEVVNTETGEMQIMATVVSVNAYRNDPFKVLLNQLQL
jgi:hypothetical protein